jgi:hypothetical protein
MTKPWMIAAVAVALATACKKENTEETKPPESTPPASDRASLTGAECQAQGGTVVGDIGDGAIHKPDYVCESGQKPIANIRVAEGEPTPIEGAVCCPGAAAAS